MSNQMTFCLMHASVIYFNWWKSLVHLLYGPNNWKKSGCFSVREWTGPHLWCSIYISHVIFLVYSFLCLSMPFGHLYTIISFCVCLGSKKVFHKEVSNITNKRLDDTLQDALPPHYKKHNILFLCGNYVGPTEMSPRYNDLSINWCIGDKDIEVLDGTKGLIVDG